MVSLEKPETILGSFTKQKSPNNENSQVERELRELGFSESEISKLNSQLDGIIERGFDRYLSKLYE